LLVGDARQHEAVEAGRPYSQLQEAGMRTAHLDEIIRQKDPELKQVVEQLSRGESQSAILDLERQGRVHQIEDREERLKTIAQEYGRQPDRTLVISPDNESRRELNSLIHREMQQHGTVSHEEHKFRVLEPRQDLTGADRAWATKYEIEDVLRYSRGSKALEVSAGEYATVKAIDHERNLLTVQRESGEQLSYNPRDLQGVSVYRQAEHDFAEGDRIQFTAPSKELHVANRELGTVEETKENGQIKIHTDSARVLNFNIEDHPHLDYGYAVTSHSGQGQTTDRVLINVDTGLGEKLVNERLAYVAVSRARHDAQIYTNDQAQLAHDLSRDYSHSTATDSHSHENANELSDYSSNEYEITPSSEDGSLEQSFAESGDAPAAAAEQGQSIGGE
jgi:ATP-dependent exoDNAse (exonuclease V) alpha subunit